MEVVRLDFSKSQQLFPLLWSPDKSPSIPNTEVMIGSIQQKQFHNPNYSTHPVFAVVCYFCLSSSSFEVKNYQQHMLKVVKIHSTNDVQLKQQHQVTRNYFLSNPNELVNIQANSTNVQ